MKKDEIIRELHKHYLDFTQFVQSIPPEKVSTHSNIKWSAAEQLNHIIKSVAPVKLAFSLPHFLLKIAFGKANRPSKNYEQLVVKYQGKLAEGGKAPSWFIPEKKRNVSSEASKLDAIVEALCKKVERFSENELDLLLLPHPLMGKLTLREMLYFTIYHVQHHHIQVKNNLSLK